MVAFAIMFVFGGVNILQLKKKQEKHPANMILIMIPFFLLHLPNQRLIACPKKHTLSFVGTEPPYFGIRVDETRAAGNNTSNWSG